MRSGGAKEVLPLPRCTSSALRAVRPTCEFLCLFVCLSVCQCGLVGFVPLHRAQRARLQRLEKETREMEKSMEAHRHAQAKIAELEKTNKKLQKQTHADRKEIIRLKEELQSFKTKVRCSLTSSRSIVLYCLTIAILYSG